MTESCIPSVETGSSQCQIRIPPENANRLVPPPAREAPRLGVSVAGPVEPIIRLRGQPTTVSPDWEVLPATE
jgi:hypothetical protein